MRQQTAEQRQIRTVGRECLIDAADDLDHPHHNLQRPKSQSPRTVSPRKRGWCILAMLCPRRPLVQRRQILYGDYALSGSYQAMASRTRDCEFALLWQAQAIAALIRRTLARSSAPSINGFIRITGCSAIGAKA